MGYLMKFRIPGVQSYIFQTPTLKEIRGASAILEDLCHKQMNQDIVAQGGEVWFMAAGLGAIYVDSEHSLKQVRTLIQRQVVKRSRILRPQFAHVDYKKSDPPVASLTALDRMLTHASPLPEPGMPLHTLFKSCQSCRRYPLVQIRDGGVTQICSACAAKRSRVDRHRKGSLPYWQKMGAFVGERTSDLDQTWQVLLDEENFIEEQVQASDTDEAPSDPGNPWTETHLPGELKDIADQSARKGYLALIYADVNQLGNALDNHYGVISKTADDYQTKVSKIRAFSQQIDRTMRQATYLALLETWPKLPSPFPFDILYLGGDDLLLVCTADGGPPFVQALCRYFREEVSKSGDLQGLTLSVGLAFAKVHTPMSALVAFVKELLKSAKARSFHATQKGSTDSVMAGYAVDFAALTDTSVLQLKTMRQEVNRTLLTVRPCDLNGFDSLLEWVDQLNQEGVSFNRLMPVLEACRRSKLQGTVAAQALIGRMDEKHSKTLLQILGCAQNKLGPKPVSGPGRFDHVPWIQAPKDLPHRTIIGDLMELAPFLKQKQVNS